MKYLLLAVFLIIIGCSASKNFSSTGEELYSEKCNGCHRLYPKKEFSNDEWKQHLDEMSKRARLTEEEKKLILTYLIK